MKYPEHINFRLSIAQLSELDMLAQVYSCSVSEYIRIALRRSAVIDSDAFEAHQQGIKIGD